MPSNYPSNYPYMPFRTPYEGIDPETVQDWRAPQSPRTKADGPQRVLRGERRGGVSVIPEVTRKDLSDPVPFRLNENFQLVAEQITQSQGYGKEVTIGPATRSYKGQVRLQAGAEVTGTLVLTPTTDAKGNYKPVSSPKLSIYADNTAAKAGGLVDGDWFRTAAGQLMVVYTP